MNKGTGKRNRIPWPLTGGVGLGGKLSVSIREGDFQGGRETTFTFLRFRPRTLGYGSVFHSWQIDTWYIWTELNLSKGRYENWGSLGLWAGPWRWDFLHWKCSFSVKKKVSTDIGALDCHCFKELEFICTWYTQWFAGGVGLYLPPNIACFVLYYA